MLEPGVRSVTSKSDVLIPNGVEALPKRWTVNPESLLTGKFEAMTTCSMTRFTCWLRRFCWVESGGRMITVQSIMGSGKVNTLYTALTQQPLTTTSKLREMTLMFLKGRGGWVHYEIIKHLILGKSKFLCF